MTRISVTPARRGLFAAVAAIGLAAGTVALVPSAAADPTEVNPEVPTTVSAAPTAGAETGSEDAEAGTEAATEEEAPATTAETAAPAAVSSDDCNAAGLARTSATVNDKLADYLAENPETNGALIEITRQPAFIAVGQLDGFFNEHPVQANDIRAIQAPLHDFQNRCNLQVSPSDALAALAGI